MFKIHMQLRPLLVRRSRKLLVVASDAGRTHAKKGLLPNHLHMRSMNFNCWGVASMRGFQSFDELTFKLRLLTTNIEFGHCIFFAMAMSVVTSTFFIY